MKTVTRPSKGCFLGIAALLASALGCGKTEVVVVDGSSTVYLMSAAVADELREVNPRLNVVVGQSGTGGGFKKFAAGEIDVCDASRPIEKAEAEACEKRGIDFIKLEVAFDGLAVTVNPANDWCDAITVEQLRTMWRREAEGSVMTWKDVNPDWPAEPLKLYGPGHDSGTFDYFTEVINGEKANCRNDYSPSENDNALVTGVAGDKGALGYFGYAYYAENTDKLKLLGVDGGAGPVKPSPKAVRDGTYKPLARPLYLYVRKASLKNKGVVDFLKFYLANAAQVAEKVRYVPVTDEIAEQSQKTLDEAAGG